ncbi:MAG: DUF4157 domain-containing protein [Balneolaceae bacterium]|nr:DUF4157 domain-containing protein [Balneolaceae bacterium]
MKTSVQTSKTYSDASFHLSHLQKEKRRSFFTQKDPGKPFFGPATLQPKLEIGSPDNAYEREADRVADQVMKMPDPAIQKFDEDEEIMMKREPGIQMKCDACEHEEQLQRKPMVQLKADNSHAASSELSQKIHSKKGSGHTLANNTKQEMEAKIGADFSKVRVHTGSNAIQLNRELGARAFTYGNQIFFNSGEYNPSTSKGKHLLAHELTHVIQQSESEYKMVQRSVNPAICEVLNFEQDHGTWATIREFNALSGTIPGRGIEVLRSNGAQFDLNWALDVSYVAGMTGGTCSEIVGTVFGRPGVLMCGGTGYITGGMSYYFARLIGAVVEGYEHGIGVGWNYLTHATLDEANVNGAEVGMLVGASGARGNATPFRAFVHTSVLEECGILAQSPVEDEK